jgi:hypothetical protein
MTKIEKLKAVRDAALGERAAIVAWLRDDAATCDCFARSEGECACGAWSDYKRVLETDIADRLECGEHLAAKEKGRA